MPAQPAIAPTIASDEDLMRRAQSGDLVAFEALYARWRDPLIRFLMRRCGARSVAEEALQETWMRVHRYRASWDAARSFRSWVFKIAAHSGHDAAQPRPEGYIWCRDDPDPIAMRDTLAAALHSLTAEERRLLLLTIEGFTAVEVAEMMDLGVSAVRMRLSRARKKIRASMGGGRVS